jgi:hypothetical protein
MAEGFYDKAKRNVKRAFDFSGSADIRNARDADETSSNIDYMLSRGKKRTPQDQSDVPAGLRKAKRFVNDSMTESPTDTDREPWRSIDKLKKIPQRITDTIQGKPMSSNQGVASKAVDVAGNRGGMFRDPRTAPAVRLFKNLRKKQNVGG